VFIGPVDLPEKILRAHREKRLVIFAGAGVSKAPPSDLPLSGELVRKISGDLGPSEGEPTEVFLGRLERNGTDVHRLATEALSLPSSRHNENHSALVALFREPRDLRIVTTNFDRHLESALKEHCPDEEIEVFEAPALPVGSQFTGLVHLHGRLGRNPKRLVLTDADYGRAYLTEGWARGFVTALFGQYLVLFVGYSYGDTPLKYLARGLPSDYGPGRFALAHENLEEWEYYGIKPIPYDSVGGHRQLEDFLRAWVTLDRRGALDVEVRFSEVLKREPWSLAPDEEGELLYYLSRPETEHLFYRHAKQPEWLEWANKKDLLNPLFECGIGHESLRLRANWFAEGALGSRGDVAARIAWQEYQGLSRLLAVTLARQVGSELANRSESSRETGIRASSWLQLILARSDPGSANLLVDLSLPHVSLEHQAELAVWLFRMLAEPRFERSRSSLNEEGQPTPLELDDRQDAWFDLNRTWAKLFKPHLDRFAPIFLPGLTAIFSEADLRLRAGGASDWDRMGLNRASIAHHEQNGFLPPLHADALIDAARDILDWHLRERPKIAEAIVEIWLASEMPLLCRLGLYGLERLPSISAAQKVRRIIDSKWIGWPAVKTELFNLLRAVYPYLELPTRQLLLAEALQVLNRGVKPDDSEDRRSATDYSFYNLLVWLQRADPSCRVIEQQLLKAMESHPEFGPREYPELSFSSSGVRVVRPISPINQDQLRTLSPQEWLTNFQKLSATDINRSIHLAEDHLRGFLDETQKIAGDDLSYGVRLAGTLLEINDVENPMWSYLLRAWGEHSYQDSEWSEVLAIVDREPLITAQTGSIVDFLEIWARRKKESEASRKQWLSALALAEKLWSIGGDGRPTISQSLAEVAIQIVSGLRSDTKQKGIPAAILPLLTKMCAAQEAPRELAVRVLATQFRYFLFLDEAWTRANLLPRFDWKNSRYATQAWHGLLNGGVDSTFIPLFEEAFPHLEKIGQQRDLFVACLAQLAFKSDSDPYQAGWLRSFLKHSSPEDRVHFSRVLSRILDDLAPEARAELWHAWLSNYFRHRFVDAPAVKETELSVFRDWAHRLGPFLGEILEQLELQESPSYLSGQYFYRLTETPVTDADPTEVVRLCKWVLRGAISGSFWEAQKVHEFIGMYIDRGAAAPALKQLIDLYVEKGGGEGSELRERLDGREAEASPGTPTSTE